MGLYPQDPPFGFNIIIIINSFPVWSFFFENKDLALLTLLTFPMSEASFSNKGLNIINISPVGGKKCFWQGKC